MKKLIGMLVVPVLLAGCGHNGNFIASGRVTRLGVADYGLLHVNGLVVFGGVRENSELAVETNDEEGFGNPDSQLRGVRSIRFRTGPQITGALNDLAEHSPEAAVEYVGKMPDINKASWGNKGEEPKEAK